MTSGGDVGPAPRDYLCVAPLVAAATVNLWKVESVRNALVIDPTLLAFTASAAVVFFSVLSRPRFVRNISPLLILVACFIPGVALSSFSTPYAIQKNTLLFTIIPFLIIAPLQLVHTFQRRQAFVTCLAVLGVVVAVGIEIGGSPATVESAGRVGLEDGNVIGLARVCSLGALCLAFRRTRARVRPFALLGALLCLHAAALTGSRGPIVAVLVGVLVGFGLAWRRSGAGWQTKLVPFVLVAAVVWLATPASRLMTANGGETDLMRADFAAAAWRLTVRHPVGIGWGDFAREMPLGLREDVQGWAQYPHNILLEAGAEGGIAAALGLVLLVVLAARPAIRAARLNEALPLALLVATLIFSLTSGDLTGNRTLWVVLGLCLSLTPHPRGGAAAPGLRATPTTRLPR